MIFNVSGLRRDLFCFISAVQQGRELTDVSLTANERQAQECRLPQAMSEAAAQRSAASPAVILKK